MGQIPNPTTTQATIYVYFNGTRYAFTNQYDSSLNYYPGGIAVGSSYQYWTMQGDVFGLASKVGGTYDVVVSLN